MSIDNIVVPPSGGLSVQDIVTKFDDEFEAAGGEVFTRKVISAINEVMGDIASRWDWKWLHQNAVVPTVAGVDTITLPPDCVALAGDPVIPNIGRVKRRSLSFLRRKAAENEAAYDSTGGARICALISPTVLKLWPTPASVYDVEVEYKTTSPVVGAVTDSLVVPLNLTNAVLLGVRSALKDDDGSDSRSTARADNKFERAIQAAIMEEINSEDTEIPDEVADSVDDM